MYRFLLVFLCFSLTTSAGEPAGTTDHEEKEPETTAAVETAQNPVKKPELLETMVVSASREAESRWRVPLAVGAIEEGEIRALNPSHPAEVMGRVAGVWVNVTGGEGHMTAIRQPLTTSPVYLYLENGVPTRSTGFFNHNALYEVNLPMSGSLEVIKGPGSALHGSDAIGGVVNVNTRRPPPQRELEVTLEGGENGYRRLLLTGGDTIGANGFRADANLTATDGWRDATDYSRESGTIQWEHTGEKTSIRALAAYSHIDQNTAGSSAISEFDYLHHPTVNYTPISLRKVEALRVSVAIDRLIGDNGLLSIVPFARDNSMDLLPNWSLSYDPALWETANTSLGFLAKYRVDFEPMSTRLIVGADVDYSPGEHREWRLNTTREGTIYTDYEIADMIYDYDVTFQGTSAYAQVELNPTERLLVNAGLRYDRMGYDYRTRLAAIDTGRWRVPGDTERDYNQLSPKLGISWLASETLNFFASYRHAFRAPSEGQLFRQGSADDTLGLEPVKAVNVDLGVRGDLGGAVQFELTGYRLEKEDDILSYSDPNTGYSLSVNAGRTLHRGVELEVSGALSKDLRLRGAFSRAKHTYDEWTLSDSSSYTGNEMETAPRSLVEVGLDYRPRWNGGEPLSLEWRMLGSYWMDPANTFKYEGHDLLHLRAGWKLAEAFTINASIQNLTDARYAESASYNAFRGKEYSPGLPRTANLYLRYLWR